ncbi:MAG: hypothetical protein AAGB05_00645 [Pseudomonadota bacterium]
MNTVETFLSLTGRTKVYPRQNGMLASKFTGIHDAQTKRSLRAQLETLHLKYVQCMGLLPDPDDYAAHVDLRAWTWASAGAWTQAPDAIPWADKTFTRRKALPALCRNPLMAFYTEALGRAPDAAGLEFWTGEITSKVLPAMRGAARENGELD